MARTQDGRKGWTYLYVCDRTAALVQHNIIGKNILHNRTAVWLHRRKHIRTMGKEKQRRPRRPSFFAVVGTAPLLPVSWHRYIWHQQISSGRRAYKWYQLQCILFLILQINYFSMFARLQLAFSALLKTQISLMISYCKIKSEKTCLV